MGSFGRKEQDSLGKMVKCVFFVECESLWKKIICGKFEEVERGWTTRVWKESFGMALWKDIRKGWEDFNARTSIRIGNVAKSWKREGDEGGVRRFILEDPSKIGRRGLLSVKPYYCSLSGETNFVFPGKEVWGSRAPLRICFFAGEAVWGKILTVDTLMKRG
ncbi:hypothetical protein CK203_032608 [Vitis vinifera]|uniref:DUF4283 domain-containing protein n=1 Tax=Vitis vinifera TaxID=29760 RepID=A0A438HXR8_VITVI|nr:hypothetical protein CK203_032608 [Vitis vinifera]